MNSHFFLSRRLLAASVALMLVTGASASKLLFPSAKPGAQCAEAACVEDSPQEAASVQATPPHIPTKELNETQPWAQKSEAALQMDWLIQNQDAASDLEQAPNTVATSGEADDGETLMEERQYSDQPFASIDESVSAANEFTAEPLDIDWAHDQQYDYIDLFSSNQKLAGFTLREVSCKSTACRLSVEVRDEGEIAEVLNELSTELMARSTDFQVFIESDPAQLATNLYIRR